MYLAMCSLRVKTEPWPIGAFGPRNATGSDNMVSDLQTLILGAAVGGGSLTKVVRHPGHGARHVGLGRLLAPYILEIALAAYQGEPRPEGNVEAGGANYCVDFQDFPGGHLYAVGDESPYVTHHDPYIVFSQ